MKTLLFVQNCDCSGECNCDEDDECEDCECDLDEDDECDGCDEWE